MLIFLSACAIYIRLDLFSYVSGDYEIYLSQWIKHLEQNGPFYSFSVSFSNYSPAYLHLLSINLWLQLKNLYFVKYLSLLFELFAAVAVYKIVMNKWADEISAAIASIVFLCLPTVIMNGAQWGQCDIIYTSFILWSVYFLTRSKMALSALMLGIAFAFKLQTIFVFPFFLLLLLKGDFKWKHIPLIFLPFLVSLIPSYLAGRDWFELLTVYFTQDISNDKNLSFNFPGIYTLFHIPVDQFILIRNIGIVVTGIFAIAIIILLKARSVSLDMQSKIILMLLFALVIPFFLPRMHERYFFIAECLSIVYAFYERKNWLVPALLQLATINTYFYYLDGKYLFPIAFSSFIVLIVIAWLCRELFLKNKFRAPEK